MSIKRAAGLGCLLLLSPALCFTAYADDDIMSDDTDPYLFKGTVDAEKGTMTGTEQTCSAAVPATSDGKIYGNIYGVTAQTIGTSFVSVQGVVGTSRFQPCFFA
ncbi:MAG: hypothetical protein Q3990_08240, partial [Desulfovibrionaceae bacterium]|nr:hypothetical protein [Desulfovibrionaceae bacterium]